MEAAHVAMAGRGVERRVAKLFDMAQRLAQDHGNTYACELVQLIRGIVALLRGEWTTAIACCDQAAAALQEHCTGVAWELSTAHSFVLWALYWSGDISELSRRREALIADARRRGDRYALTNGLTIALPPLLQDCSRLAQEQTEEAMRLWPQDGFSVQHFHAWYSLLFCELYRDDEVAAWERVCRTWPVLQRSLLLRGQVFRIVALDARVRSALAVMRHDARMLRICGAVERDIRRVAREGCSWAQGLTLLAEAALRSLAHKGSESTRLLRQALGAFDASGMALHAAVTRRRLGELLGGEEGRGLLAESDAYMAAHGVVRPQRLAAVLAPGFPSEART